MRASSALGVSNEMQEVRARVLWGAATVPWVRGRSPHELGEQRRRMEDAWRRTEDRSEK